MPNSQLRRPDIRLPAGKNWTLIGSFHELFTEQHQMYPQSQLDSGARPSPEMEIDPCLPRSPVPHRARIHGNWEASAGRY